MDPRTSMKVNQYKNKENRMKAHTIKTAENQWL